MIPAESPPRRGVHGRCCASLLSPGCTPPRQPKPAGWDTHPRLSATAIQGQPSARARQRLVVVLLPQLAGGRPRPCLGHADLHPGAPDDEELPQWVCGLIASKLARLPTTTAAEKLAAIVDDILCLARPRSPPRLRPHMWTCRPEVVSAGSAEGAPAAMSTGRGARLFR
jgi:hypothetical protein